MSNISNVIKSVQDIMRQDAGVDGDAQRISQLVWMIFLKIFDVKEQEWELEKDNYKAVIPKMFRWSMWAEKSEGITGDDLLDFINNKLFPGLKNLEISDEQDKRSLIVKTLFEDSFNYMKSGTILRQVINKLNEIDFINQKERHLFNDIYEKILKDLQSAGNAGEFYTPRPVTQFIVDMVDLKLGKIVLDPACGTGGFLISAIEKLKEKASNPITNENLNKSIKGIEKKQLPYTLSVTNMLLHNIDEPDIRHVNSFRIYKEYEDNVDIVVTNPPFEGIEEEGIEKIFPAYQTKETADLFLTMVMEVLRPGGKCGIVLPDGFLFGEGVKTSIKERLLKEFNLHTIVRLPNGVFAPYTDIKTNLLFFDKDGLTKEIWYYEQPLPKGYKKYTKTKPIRHKDFDTLKKWWDDRKENELAWKINTKEIIKNNYNLDISNPKSIKEEEIIDFDEITLKLKDNLSKTNKLLDDIIKEVKNA